MREILNCNFNIDYSCFLCNLMVSNFDKSYSDLFIDKVHNLKHVRSITLCCKDIGIGNGKNWIPLCLTKNKNNCEKTKCYFWFNLFPLININWYSKQHFSLKELKWFVVVKGGKDDVRSWGCEQAGGGLYVISWDGCLKNTGMFEYKCMGFVTSFSRTV